MPEHRLCVAAVQMDSRNRDVAGNLQRAGRVRKSHPCSVEAYVFAAGDDGHVLETAFGRIGVAICYEGSLRAVWDDILAHDPDLVLMPMSASSPERNWLCSARRVAAYQASFRDGARQCAQAFGIPHLMANKWGEWVSDLPSFWPRIHSRFPGFTHIADGDGRELARVMEGEGVAIAEVHLESSRKSLHLAPEKDAFKPRVAEVPRDYRLFRWAEALGRRWYAKHPERLRLARMLQRKRAGSDVCAWSAAGVLGFPERLGHAIVEHDIDCRREIHATGGGNEYDIPAPGAHAFVQRAIFRAEYVERAFRVAVFGQWSGVLDQFDGDGCAAQRNDLLQIVDADQRDFLVNLLGVGDELPGTVVAHPGIKHGINTVAPRGAHHGADIFG